ncbi:MAG: NAD(P)-dependent oxidoreductase [Clostridia bacterium]|nr:NAD(P)-dependent oxidoreductase [Clostridia bacterium]
MKILVTGGCGNIGKYMVEVFSKKGHRQKVVDIDKEGLEKLDFPNVETLAGDISDREFIFEAVKDMDAIVHLAWSFSNDPMELFDVDVRGYVNLLDAALEFGVEHVVNASTAVAYGKPQYSPVDEKHPRIVEEARKPMYALAKLATEKLSQIYALEHDMAINSVMIWYAYAEEIGGKHLRSMIREAMVEGVIEIPADSGGSFLQLDDFISGLEGIFEHKPKGKMFNFGTVYLTWEELAEIIIAKANPKAKVKAIPKDQWTGSTFLTDDWQFTCEKAEKMLGFKTRFTKGEAVEHLGRALEACIAEVKQDMAD